MKRKLTRKASQPGYKVCPKCDTEKPFGEFHLSPSGQPRTYCKPCKYQVAWKDAKPRSMEALAASFWAKVEKRGPDECWLWTGSKNNYGYGQIWTGGRPQTEQVHRVALMLAGVPLPDRKTTGFVVDHACRNILCVNVRHLRIVPHAANVNELADRSRVGERMRLARALGRGELRRKRTPEDDIAA